MPALLTATANDLLTRVGTELGLDRVSDPFSSTAKEYVQLRGLLQIAGEELSLHYPWAFLLKEYTFTTDGTGDEALPDDFLYMVNQTAWDRTNDTPLDGPLSPQEWQYRFGAGIQDSVVSLAFRISEGEIKYMPTTDSGTSVAFEYVSRDWVLDATTGNTYTDEIGDGADTPQFDRTLLSRFVKVKFLEAKGFDTTKAQADLNQSFQLLTAREKGSPILSASRRAGFPYLDGFGNTPDTGYG